MAFLRLPTNTTTTVAKKGVAPAPQGPRPVPKAVAKGLLKPAPGPTTVAEGPKRRLAGLGSVRVGRQYTVLGTLFAVLFAAAAIVVFKDNREATYGTVYVSTSLQ